MGMHFGFVVADVPASKLVAALDEIAPQFVDHGPITSLEEIEAFAETGWELAVGDLGDRCCLFDGTYTIASDADLIARVAARTGGLVIGCSAETVSGSFDLVVARGERLLRHYSQCDSSLTEPYSMGDAMPGEDPDELDDIDGAGLMAVAAAHGFDYERWYEQSAKRKLVWNARHLEGSAHLPWKGAQAAALDKHHAAYAHPPGEEPKIGLLMREIPAQPARPPRQLFDQATSPSKKPWWRFW
jgi:hypothetical protein